MTPLRLPETSSNAIVNVLAGEAVLLHPQPSADQRTSLAYYLRRAPLVARAIGAALSLFQPSEASRMRRLRPPADAAAAREQAQHYWVFDQGKWRCVNCGT